MPGSRAVRVEPPREAELMIDESFPPPAIRVVRVLARDDHTERILVQLDEGGDAAPAEIVRARDEEGSRALRRAISALDRLQPIGIGGLLDVLDDTHGPAMVLAHQRGPMLSETLLDRPRWTAGEAVAVLAPLAGAVERMHDAGVAHGALGTARVLITLDGVAVTGFGSAELFRRDAPESVREGVAAVVRDREAVREIAGEILDRVEGARTAAAGELSGRIRIEPGPELMGALACGLAQLAAATPIVRDDAGETPGHDAHLIAGGRTAETNALPGGARSIDDFLAGVTGADLRGIVRAIAERMTATVSRIPAGRRRIVVGGGAAVAVAALLLAVIPPSGETAPLSVATAAPSPEGSSSTGDIDRESADIVGDDPAAAVVQLLERREGCFRELSVLCLDGVDQLDSVALATDRTAILALRDGGEASAPTVEAVTPRIVERLGDSALLEVGPETAPASLLIMRSEAGWRIRDWVAGG